LAESCLGPRELDLSILPFQSKFLTISRSLEQALANAVSPSRAGE
jgi:hypothetical protein